ncbi:cytochrome ubiquinol oxidase subunit I [Escherichia coli]
MKPSGKRNLRLLPFTLFGIPDQEEETNKFCDSDPFTHWASLQRVPWIPPVIGLKELMVQHEERIRNGMKAYSLLEQLRSGSTDRAVRDQFNSMKKDLGYGLLMKRYTPNVADATEAQIQQANQRLHPACSAAVLLRSVSWWRVASLLLAIIALSFWSVIRNRIGEKKWLLRAALYGIPLPWIAVEAGWFVAEYGRQPWAIGEVLPTAVANSSLTAGDLIFSMVLICGLYTLFPVAELFLMFKFARLGPSSLKTGRYHFEQSSTTTQPAR